VRKLFTFLLLFTASIGFAQKITRVNLLQSESFIGMKVNGKSTQKVIKPVFSQDNATLTCDSALFYIDRNSFDAFGNVHINQADSINIYSDLLNYDGNTKLAILKNNVRMIDKEAVLTTNDLDYNMASKVGRYYNGGKIVNGANTLTSTNGYYFSSNKDAYFRYNVKVKSPDVTIFSDTLKYNTQSKIAYFFGPTNIYGKDDTLYTENGQYNTINDQAAFGKKNLYTQGSKSLKGDSLFYDGLAGYGRAVKNILFKDTAQKIELRGNLGIYHKKNESIEVTQNAYVVFETSKDSVTKDSMYLTADTLKSRVLRKSELYTLKIKSVETPIIITTDDLQKNSSLDSLQKKPFAKPLLEKDSLKLNSVAKISIIKKPDETTSTKNITKPKKIKSSTNKSPIRTQPIPIELITRAPDLKSVYGKLERIPKKQLGIRAIPVKVKAVKIIIPIVLPPEASDTSKIRVLSAYRKVKIFKSDLQAVADSAFFSYGDSTLRIYQKPMIWAQGSQLSADTMYVQMKKNKLDNMDLIKNSIIVNTEKDSVSFNQVGGKKMKGYFVKDKLDRVFVNGNAESIYFPQDSAQKGSMLRTVASSMRVNFEKDSLKQILWIRKPEVKIYPKSKITEELRTLDNFSWKPKDRPISKEQIIPTFVKPKKTILVKPKKNAVPLKPKKRTPVKKK
jgi:lipopolysaccharide export system protein LptA